jgi:TonB-dependent receptor
MPSIRRLVLNGLCFWNFFALALFAQTGNISGTITDSSRRVLVGAQVQVEARPLITSSDDSGKYTLLGVPAGQTRVTVSYLGFESSSRDIPVAAGVTATLDFTLGLPGVTTELTVSAAPESVGQQRALNDQKNSITLVNIVAADQINSFPDPNAAEATQRIPAIVVQRDQGEGRYVLIRGTEPRLSATTINGERIGTTENTSRQIPLDTIPADLMGAIEVTKVLTPDLEADSIGGRVNLVTKRAPASRHFGFTLGSGFNTLVKDDIKDYNGTYGQRFFNGKLGVIASANYYENNRGSQDLEPSYNSNLTLNSLDLRDYVLTRTRKGGVWDLNYTLGPGSELYLRGLRTEYEDSELRHRLRDLTSNGRLERLLRNRYHDSNQTAITLGGNQTMPGSVLLSWRTSYSTATLDTPYRIESTFRQTGATFSPNVTPSFIDDTNIQASPQNQNLSSFDFIQNAIQNDRGYERNLSGSVDFSVPNRFAPKTSGLLKFGVKVRDENRTRDVNTITQTPAAGTTYRLLDYINPSYTPADDYLHGKYSEFGSAFPDADKMLALSRSGSLTTVVAPTGDSGGYRAKERVTGAYIMNEVYLGDRTVLVPGVRMESTTTTYSAPQYVLASNGTVQSRSIFADTGNYTNILPGIHLRHEVFHDTPLRISFSRSLARPNYSDLAPFVLQDPTALTISKGNPNLKTTTANNFDASIEHYFQNVGIISAGFFYKNLGNYMYSNTIQQTIGSDLYRVTTPVNGDTANLYGFEFTLVRRLTFLPGVLNGISTYGNYTYVHSNAKLPRGDFILPGQAENMGNASIGYEKKGFTSRVSLNYQGRYILAVGADAATDNWLDHRVELDLSVSQRINKHFRIFIDALNLLNKPYRVYMAGSTYPIQEERYKIWAITGVKLDF